MSRTWWMAVAYCDDAFCVSDWYLTLLQAVAEAVEGVVGDEVQEAAARCFVSSRESEKRPQQIAYLHTIDAETIELALKAHGNTEREGSDE